MAMTAERKILSLKCFQRVFVRRWICANAAVGWSRLVTIDYSPLRLLSLVADRTRASTFAK